MQTSNSVHVLVPGEIDPGDADAIRRQCMIAVAQCGSTLELAGVSTESATHYLRAALPLYDGPNDGAPGSGFNRSKAEVLSDIPLSEGEISRSWESLCAFESRDMRSCFQPSARALVRAWSNIVSTATIGKIALEGNLAHDHLSELTASSEETPSELIEAIFDHLMMKDDHQPRLDSQRTVEFVGRSLIQDLVEIQEQDLMRQWQNLLPEAWRDSVDMALLEVSATHNLVRRLLTSIGHLSPDARHRDGKTEVSAIRIRIGANEA